MACMGMSGGVVTEDVLVALMLHIWCCLIRVMHPATRLLLDQDAVSGLPGVWW